MERPHLFTLGYNNKIAKLFSQHLKIFYSWTIGPDYNINVYDHNFAQMYSLIWTGFSGERCGQWASCFFYFLVVLPCSITLFLEWEVKPQTNKQTNRQTFSIFWNSSPFGPPFEAARNEVNILWNEMMNHLWNDLS